MSLCNLNERNPFRKYFPQDFRNIILCCNIEYSLYQSHVRSHTIQIQVLQTENWDFQIYVYSSFPLNNIGF
jgi:hypothetical protein